MGTTPTSRRHFIKKTAAAGTFLTLSGPAFSRILGANDRLNFAVIGVHSRGLAHLKAITKLPNCEVSHICDVDTRALAKAQQLVESNTGRRPQGFRDLRVMLEDPDIDVITIATPEHWHAPMAIMGLEAGTHVYVEKPCSFNGSEAEWLIAAQQQYGQLVQMGNQQRSAPASIEGIQDIHQGLIGEVHFGKAWYANRRGSIGHGKQVAVPEWLDWELWQGPAPRKPYKDNYVHYDWHWFKHWGTGEVNNNATHEVDVCRWALQVDFPTRVSSSGGRYFYDDDWEFPDTNLVNWEYEDGKMITWEGKSCIPAGYHGEGRGAMIYGSEGQAIFTRNYYEAFDRNGQSIKRVEEAAESATLDTGGEGLLDIYHFQNLVDGIRDGAELHAPIADAAKSTMLCHLGNMAYDHGGALDIDPRNGHILENPAAERDWYREYEPGWSPQI